MGIGDKFKHAAQDVGGKAKEAAGRTRSDKPLKDAGKREQQRSHLKKAAEHVRDAFKR
jgi:uncharacterized protein YjbJ (UPF0337 family)